MNINGNALLTFSNFFLGNSTGSHAYQAGDIAIDLSSPGGTQALLQYTANPSGPTGDSTFTVGAGQNSGFIVTYKMVLTPITPGTVAFIGAEVSMNEVHTGTGFGSLQLTNLSVSACQAATTPGNNPKTCSLLPALGTSINGVGNIMSINGNSAGTVSFSALNNLFDTSFTSSVPEPGSVVCVGLGLAALLARRFRR